MRRTPPEQRFQPRMPLGLPGAETSYAYQHRFSFPPKLHTCKAKHDWRVHISILDGSKTLHSWSRFLVVKGVEDQILRIAYDMLVVFLEANRHRSEYEVSKSQELVLVFWQFQNNY